MATLRITWTKSGIGYAQNQKDTIRALGLKRLHHTVEQEDSRTTRRMVRTVAHLVTVEEVGDGPA